mmetsp:Transcript_2389/g.5980  ORF Transcript_2389/g.5980 Transcript_2389/m.5980 type:complete len:202 (+) Transcript_2389:1658-2263(+)
MCSCWKTSRRPRVTGTRALTPVVLSWSSTVPPELSKKCIKQSFRRCIKLMCSPIVSGACSSDATCSLDINVSRSPVARGTRTRTAPPKLHGSKSTKPGFAASSRAREPRCLPPPERRVSHPCASARLALPAPKPPASQDTLLEEPPPRKASSISASSKVYSQSARAARMNSPRKESASGTCSMQKPRFLNISETKCATSCS